MTQGPIPPQPQPVYAVARAEKATLALILGILGILVCPLVLSIPAIIFGRQAVREVDASGGQMQGGTEAKVGFWLGVAGTVWGAVTLIFFVVMMVSGALLFAHACHNLPSGQHC